MPITHNIFPILIIYKAELECYNQEKGEGFL